MSKSSDRLKQRRKLLGMSQKQLAELCELPASSISHFEAGSREPCLANLKKIKRALNVPYEMLLSGEAE